jgi:RNA polymerase sigma-70 factor (ECF subfamily)
MSRGNYDDYTDEELLAEFVRQDDREALGVIISRYYDQLFRVCRAKVPDVELVRDVIQDVFVLLVRKSDSLLDHSSLASWLVRAAVFESKKAIRKELNRTKRHLSYAKQEELSAGLFPAAAFRELDRALSRLSKEHRKVLLLRYSEGLSFDEMALRLGSTPSAVQRMVSRVVAKLRDAFSNEVLEYGEGSDGHS